MRGSRRVGAQASTSPVITPAQGAVTMRGRYWPPSRPWVNWYVPVIGAVSDWMMVAWSSWQSVWVTACTAPS